MDLGPTLIQYNFMSILNYICKDYFQIKSYSEVLGGYELQGDAIQLTVGCIHNAIAEEIEAHQQMTSLVPVSAA